MKLTLMYKIINGPCPDYLKNLVSFNETGHYNLRYQRTISVPLARLDTFKRSFIPHMSGLWNKLPDEIQHAKSILTFKQLLHKNVEKNSSIFMVNDGPLCTMLV